MATQIIFDRSEWDKFLNVLGSNVKKSAPLLKVAGSTFAFRNIIKHFKNEMGPDGKWRRLALSTLRARTKGRRKRSPKILQDTGNLRRNFQPSNIKQISNNGVMLFNPTPYGGLHNEGIGVPKREFMWIDDRTENRILDFILDKLVR